jgi:putative sigma-54 modulation protein
VNARVTLLDAQSTIGRIFMQIEVKGRNTPVTAELREHVERRFTKVGKQVSEFARLEVEIYEERNPAIADNQVAEATLALKGVTLRARDRARDLRHAINLCEAELSRQVKRHREKRRARRRSDSIRTPEPETYGEGTAIAT